MLCNSSNTDTLITAQAFWATDADFFLLFVRVQPAQQWC